MASAHVKIELDPRVFARIVEELELKHPPSFTMHSLGRMPKEADAPGHARFRGLYDPRLNHVTIANGSESYSRERQPELVKHLSFTVLHELRHAWQRENWDAATKAAMSQGPYETRGEEQDANAWAEYAQPKFPFLVKVTRRPVGGKSPFARQSERWAR